MDPLAEANTVLTLGRSHRLGLILRHLSVPAILSLPFFVLHISHDAQSRRYLEGQKPGYYLTSSHSLVRLPSVLQ